MSPPARQPQSGVALSKALAEHPQLGSLLQRMQASRDALAAIIDLIPDGLRNEVQAGPLDDTGWTLLAAHAPAAAKLRQLLPQFAARLAERGLAATPVRVKVLAAR